MNREGSRQKKKQILGGKPFQAECISNHIAGQWEKSVLGSMMASEKGGDQSMKKAPSVKPSRIVRGCHVIVRRTSSYCGMERYGTKGAGETDSKPQWGVTQRNQNLTMGVREAETREVGTEHGFSSL